MAVCTRQQKTGQQQQTGLREADQWELYDSVPPAEHALQRDWVPVTGSGLS